MRGAEPCLSLTRISKKCVLGALLVFTISLIKRLHAKEFVGSTELIGIPSAYREAGLSSTVWMLTDSASDVDHARLSVCTAILSTGLAGFSKAWCFDAIQVLAGLVSHVDHAKKLVFTTVTSCSVGQQSKAAMLCAVILLTHC